MNLIRRNQGSGDLAGRGGLFADFHREMDSLIRNLFSELELPVFAQSRHEGNLANIINPSFEIAETDTEFQVNAEIPGMTEKDVEVNLEEGILTIKGEKKEEKDEKKKNYHLYERRYGSFQRSFTLPQNIDPEKITAAVKNGVLEVRIPKKEPTKSKAKKIEVKAK